MKRWKLFRYIFKISDSKNIFGTHFVGNMNEILDSLPWFIFNKSPWNGLFELEFNYPRNIFISDDLPEITLIYCHVLRLIWFFYNLSYIKSYTKSFLSRSRISFFCSSGWYTTFAFLYLFVQLIYFKSCFMHAQF